MKENWLSGISPQLNHGGTAVFQRGIINAWRLLVDHELFLFEKGEAELIIDNVSYVVKSPGYIIIPPGKEHISYCHSKECLLHWLHFDWNPVIGKRRYPFNRKEFCDYDNTLLEEFPKGMPVDVLTGPVCRYNVFSLHKELLQMFYCQNENNRNISRYLVLGELLMLLEPFQEDKSAGNQYHVVSHIVDALKNDLINEANSPFNEAKSVREILAEYNYSYFHLTRIFKEMTSYSPVQYIAMIRIERIKYFIQNYSMTISEIAYELGFDDVRYFCRFFKKQTGMSPGEYSKSLRS